MKNKWPFSRFSAVADNKQPFACNKKPKYSFYILMTETESKESYSHILKYTGIFGGVQGLNIMISLVRNKLVAMLLGPGGMGLTSLFNSAVNFISQTTSLGISFSAVRHLSEIFDEGNEEHISHFIKVVRAWCLLAALLGMFVCLAVGPLLSDWTFSWGDHTLHFLLLAPAVAMLAVTGGETAILKASRRLKALAVTQISLVVISLFVSIPLYYLFGESGIIPVIVLMAFIGMIVTMLYSYRFYPLRIGGLNGILGEGMEMIRLGVAFTVAGIFGSGAEIAIRAYLNVNSDLSTVGLYNAGFMLTVTYAGMVFSAMETDYFPRLSAINHDIEAVNTTVNRQIEVSVLLLSPMLAIFMLSLPILLPLLYTASFLPVVAMTQVASLSMYFKSVYLPVSYIVLAKGDSKAFLVLEALSYIFLVIFVIVGYTAYGLLGTGIALSLSNLLDLVLAFIYAGIRYSYRPSLYVLKYSIIQLTIGMSAYAVTFVTDLMLYCVLGLVVCLVSVAYSIHILRRKTTLWEALMRRVSGRLGRK